LSLVALGLCLAALFLGPRANLAQQPAAGNPAVRSASLLNHSIFPAAAQFPFPFRDPMSDLAEKVKQDANQPRLHAGVFVAEPDTGKHMEIDARRAYSAASMIKLPVLVALLQAIDSGKVKFEQNVVIRSDLKGGGSGCLQWRASGSHLVLNDCAQLMMVISDNTATNIIVDLLGGKENCNREFANWGLTQTRINNWLPDLPGTNTTSPYDLSLLLAKVDAGQLLSPSSRAWLFHTMEKSRIRTLLPMGIPAGSRIADKTGDIASIVGDAGIITAPGGKRYIVTVAVERPSNDRRANAMIRQISKDVYAGITGDTEGIKALEEQQAKAAAVVPHTVRHGKRHRRRHH
jgi:beta-lactamase class A